MRCPSCNKFAGLETQDPEVNDVSADYEDGKITVTANGRTVRNSACCNEEMKAIDLEMTEEIDPAEIPEIAALSDSKRGELFAALEDGTAEVEVDENGSSYDESGGGRYKKNMLTSRIEVTVKIMHGDVTYTKDVTLEQENAASEFEEQC